jgi:hypothetical protein
MQITILAPHGHWAPFFSAVGCHKCRRAFGVIGFIFAAFSLFHPVRPFRNDGGNPRRGLVPRIRFRSSGGAGFVVGWIIGGHGFRHVQRGYAYPPYRGWFPNVSSRGWARLSSRR